MYEIDETTKCPKCGKEVTGYLTICPDCGYSPRAARIKKLSEILGYIYLILGTIGSIIIANDFGKLMASRYEDRDWAVTIGTFAGAFLSVLIISIILMGIGAILERLEYILDKPNTELQKEDSPNND